MKVNKSNPYAKIKCIDGVARYCLKCVGFCNNYIHEGGITKELLKQHECIQKECVFFEVSEINSYFSEQKTKFEKKKARKKKINEIRKRNKANERRIIEFADKLIPEESEIILCKHLYDSTFILVTNSLDFNKNMNLSQKIYSELRLHVFVKDVSQKIINNIEYTYESLLPEDMKERVKKYKMRK